MSETIDLNKLREQVKDPFELNGRILEVLDQALKPLLSSDQVFEVQPLNLGTKPKIQMPQTVEGLKEKLRIFLKVIDGQKERIGRLQEEVWALELKAEERERI